jgi:hypothetical protein
MRDTNATGCGWATIGSFTPSTRSKTSFTCLASAIERKFTVTAKILGVKVGAHPMSLACTGNPNGPSLFHLLEVTGKEKALASL